jgi:hypothetical protein
VHSGCVFYTLMVLSVRTSLQSSSFELHTHLSHGLIRYLGMSSPKELAEFGLTSAGDLVDFISRVRLFPQILNFISRFSVCDQYVHGYFAFVSSTWSLCLPCRRIDQPFLRSERRDRVPSCVCLPHRRGTPDARHCIENHRTK